MCKRIVSNSCKIACRTNLHSCFLQIHLGIHSCSYSDWQSMCHCSGMDYQSINHVLGEKVFPRSTTSSVSSNVSIAAIKNSDKQKYVARLLRFIRLSFCICCLSCMWRTRCPWFFYYLPFAWAHGRMSANTIVALYIGYQKSHESLLLL